MKILNGYCGIGGNRKLWGNEYQITAVEINPEIANIYKDFFPDDEVIVCDFHQYLLKHYKEYDFIWSSPPCPTHSRFNFLNEVQNKQIKYADMTLYQEILLLSNWSKNNKWCIENVISYYKPLINPQEINNHYFWCNFYLSKMQIEKRGIRRNNEGNNKTGIKWREKKLNINLDNYKINNIFKKKILNNCTEPKLGLAIFNAAFKNIQLSLI